MDVKAALTLPIADCRLVLSHRIITSPQWQYAIGNWRSAIAIVDLHLLRETFTLTLRTGSQRMRPDEVADLPSLSGPHLVGRSEVNSRIDTSIDNLVDGFIECFPLTCDARECNHERHARILSKLQLEDRGHRAAVSRVSRGVVRVSGRSDK